MRSTVHLVNGMALLCCHLRDDLFPFSCVSTSLTLSHPCPSPLSSTSLSFVQPFLCCWFFLPAQPSPSFSQLPVSVGLCPLLLNLSSSPICFLHPPTAYLSSTCPLPSIYPFPSTLIPPPFLMPLISLIVAQGPLQSLVYWC